MHFLAKDSLSSTQSNLDEIRLEQEISRLGNTIFHEVKNSTLSVFDSQFYTGKLMDWAMKDQEFKISLLRFVDVLPALQSSTAIIRHAQEYFKPVAHRIPGLLKWGLDIDPSSLAAKVAAPLVKKQVRSMAEQFIAGESPQEGLKNLRKIRAEKMAFTVDILGEAVVGEVEADDYLNKYLDLLDQLATHVPSWKESAEIVAGHRGEVTPINISVKLSALYSQAKPLNVNSAVLRLGTQLGKILHRAKACGAFVYIDMEDSSLTTITIDTFKHVLESSEFKDYDRVGLVLQAYMRRTEDDLRSLIHWGQKRNVPFGIRLVKGAYWDTETILGKLQGWEIPVWQKKTNSDATYENLTRLLLDNHDIVNPAFGSHNLRSLCHAVVAAELLQVPKTAFELQFLHGMAEPIKRAFVERGFLVREYVPIGELLPGMGYLVRRLLENTSNEGFLRQSFHEHERPEVLLQKPEFDSTDTGTEHLVVAPTRVFTNSPLRDFSLQETRSLLQNALGQLHESLAVSPRQVFPVITGQHISGGQQLASISPEDPRLILAQVTLANVDLANQAVSKLTEAFPVWRDTPWSTRSAILFKAAQILEKRREEFTAVMILEAGKPWIEADADVAEAIDFLNYYALAAEGLGIARKPGGMTGEDNRYFYEPRGITAVISPWNFPLAIPCGMFAAALVTGNCAILKPAEQTSFVASLLFEVFLQAGLPPTVAAFLPGLGEEVGAHLVTHPGVSTIVFTGSKDVGLEINKQAALSSYHSEHVKRVIIEMGGKNAIIVDEGADLDEAIKGVIYSAFSYQGQKCSACSRVIVVGDAYQKFIERLTEATKCIFVGPPSDPETLVGPVIDQEACERIGKIIQEAKKRCHLLVEGPEPKPGSPSGFYVRPTIFTEIPKEDVLLKKEIFGPVLAIVQAETFAHALASALDSDYGLTGAVFSRSPKNILHAKEAFRVGNLYLNRGSTGALVMRQPFGGAKMSGVGSKAGGPDYLLQFVIPRVVTENTLRRGFAPIE